MKFGSVCSGIEAASCAWEPLGWKAAFFSEIEKFPSQVLAHHYPDVPNMGDMTKFKEWPDADINVLVGGTPCQSFSVAGLRRGLDDPRGNLMLTFLAIADRYRPKWLVWENVPGVLSSNGGKDFGTFLGGLGELGYGFAYRVLDAQYFGVPQRRRRVFVVACLGNWQSAAAVLFERHCFEGHPAPSRKKGEDIAGTFTARANSGGWGSDVDLAAGNYMQPVAKCLTASKGQRNDVATDNFVGFWNGNDIAESLTCTSNNQRMPDKGKMQMVVQPAAYGLAGTMIGRKDENGPNGKGWYEEACPTQTKTDIHAVAITHPVAYALDSLASNSMKSANPISGCNEVDISKALDTSRGLDPSCNQGGMAVAQPIAYNIAPGKGLLKDDIHITNADATKTLDAFGSNPAMHQGGAAIVQPIAFSGQMSNPQTDVDMTGTLGAKNPMAVCLGGQHPNAGIGIDQSPTLTEAMGAGGGHIPIMAQPIAFDAYNQTTSDTVAALRCAAGGVFDNTVAQPIAPTLTAANNPSRSPQASEVTDQIAAVYATSMAVRRLTPVECERLQGFPDGYTDIQLKGKPTPDGPRYKALGNSMAVPVMRWIGQRIEAVDRIK